MPVRVAVVRTILLTLAQAQKRRGSGPEQVLRRHPDIGANMRLLIEQGFVEGSVTQVGSEVAILAYRITRKGTALLEALRDPAVCRSTESAVRELGGTTSLDLVQSMAEQGGAPAPKRGGAARRRPATRRR